MLSNVETTGLSWSDCGILKSYLGFWNEREKYMAQTLEEPTAWN